MFILFCFLRHIGTVDFNQCSVNFGVTQMLPFYCLICAHIIDILSCKIPVIQEKKTLLFWFLNFFFFLISNDPFKKLLGLKSTSWDAQADPWVKNVDPILLFKCEHLLYIQWVIVLIVLCYSAGVKINKYFFK